MAPKNLLKQEEQIVWLRHRKRDRLPHRSARPARLARCRIFRSVRFRPACRKSDDCAGHNSGRSPIRHGHLVVLSSSKNLSSQFTSVGRQLLREKDQPPPRKATARRGGQRSIFDVRRSMFDVRRSMFSADARMTLILPFPNRSAVSIASVNRARFSAVTVMRS